MTSYKLIHSSCITDYVMCRGAPSCMKIILTRHARCWSVRMIWLCKRLSSLLPMTEHAGPISSKYNAINDASIHTTPFQNDCEGWSGIGACMNGFSSAHILKFCVLTKPWRWKWASSIHKCSMTIHCPFPWE